MLPEKGQATAMVRQSEAGVAGMITFLSCEPVADHKATSRVESRRLSG
jgi:hypothetical protein